MIGLVAGIVVCVLLLAGLVLLLAPRWVADRRCAAHAAWVGVESLTDVELQRVIVWRYREQLSSTEARARVLRRRAVEEDLRRGRALGQRRRKAQIARARRLKGRKR